MTRVCIGVVTAPHGVRGLVKVKPFTAEPEGVAAYGPVEDEAGHRRFQLTLQSWAKDQWIARIEGVGDRNAAEALKGVRFYVDRSRLPEPEEEAYYHADLIGLEARLKAGGVLGRVRAVHDFGAGDILEVQGPSGVVEVPFTRAAVPEIRIAEGWLLVDPPPGLLEPPEEDPPR